MAYTIGVSDAAELAAFEAGAPAFVDTNLLAPPHAAVDPRWTRGGLISDTDATDPDFPVQALYDWDHIHPTKSTDEFDVLQYINVQLAPLSDVDTFLFRVEVPDDGAHTVGLEIASDALFTVDLLELLPVTAVDGTFRFELSGSTLYENLEHVRLRIGRTGAGPVLNVLEFTIGKRIVLNHAPAPAFDDKPRIFQARGGLSLSRGFTRQIYSSDASDNQISYPLCSTELSKLQGVRAATLSGSRALFARLSGETGWSLGRFGNMNFLRTAYSRHDWNAQFQEKPPFRGRETVFVSGQQTNVIDKYNWDTAYECQDVSGTDWPPAGAGVTLATTIAPTTGVSTSGWANLPARMVDQAISPGAASYNNPLFDWQSNDFHWRGILDLDAGVINGDRILRYVVTGLRLAEIRIISETNINFTVFNSTGGGVFTGSFSGGGAPTGRLLIDWWVNGVQMGLYVNGVDYSPANHPSAVTFQNGPDSIDVLGNTVAEGVHVFQGFRWDETLSLAEHQADATELGL